MDEQQMKEDVSNLTRRLTEPASSIPEKTSGHFFCTCSVCISHSKKSKTTRSTIQAKEDFANYEGKEKSFTWLLKELGKASKNNSIKINIPETVVFRKSKPNFLIYQRPDRTLKTTISAQKLKLPELKKLFSFISRQRKREEGPLTKPLKQEIYGKETALVRYMLRECDNESAFIPASYEGGALRVMQEAEFTDLMLERAGSPIWKKISYIQTVVKCKVGISETYVMTYYSHDANDTQAILELQQIGKDDSETFESSFMSSIEKYGEYICKKIAYILAIYAQQELLRFSPEFIMDDNGKVWLTYATKIAVREIEIGDKNQEILFKRVDLRNVESKERLNEELQNGFNEPRAPHQLRMLSQMSKHYVELKDKIGINELFKEKPKDPLSSEAFSKLRPFSPYSLYELIEPASLKKIQEKELQRKKSVRIRTARGSMSSRTLETQRKNMWFVRSCAIGINKIT